MCMGLCTFFTLTVLFSIYTICGYLILMNVNEKLVVIRDDILFKLDIIHFNDFHARFEETSVPYAICKSNDSSCLGGFARLHHEVSALRRARPGALVLNAGDTYQGSYWYTLMKWNVTQNFINMLHSDVHALGNHEFDDGIPGLVPYLKALKAPVVAANLDSRNTELNGLYQPHVILERSGRKIGVIGLLTPETQYTSRANGVLFLDPVEVVKKAAEDLNEKGVDIIIVLSHCGITVDRKMAAEVGEHIDLIVGGHTHSLLWNGEAPSKMVVEGPYPLLVESEANPGHNVLIVTASSYTKYLGHLTVYFDDTGELQSFDGSPVFLNRSIPEDPEILSLMQPYTDRLHKYIGEVVGYTSGDLELKSCRTQECALGDIVTDALVHAAKTQVKSNLPVIGYLAGPVLRTSISKGTIRRGDIINMSPFTNQVVTFRVMGQDLIDQLKQSFRNPETKTKSPFAAYTTPQVSGIKLKVNATTSEILSAAVKVGDEYEELDEEKEYQVVTTDFLTISITTVFYKHHNNLTKLGLDAEVIETYLKKISPIHPHIEDRIQFIS